MNDRETKTFFFSPFRMDPARRLLTRDGQPIVLKPKEFDTLLVLVKEDGRVVDKDDLMAQVWPDSYVTDGSLAKNISILRKALGEDVIETHRGRGYRVTVPIVATLPGLAGPALISNAAPESMENSAEVSVASPANGKKQHRWRSQKARAVWVIMGALLLAFAAYRFIVVKAAGASHSSASAPPVRSILIQKEGALDPLSEGFGLSYPDGNYTHVIRNADNTGFDRWRLVTEDQNFYYRKLSDAEKDFALQHDWTLTCICALMQGGGSSDIDLGPGKGPRFDMAYLQEGNKYFVVLTNQISPHYEFDPKIEFPGVADIDHPHTYQMRFDHLTQTASLWIDGQLKASGYRGHHQYQQNYGLMFGAATYRDVKQASVVFREVRFEAN